MSQRTNTYEALVQRVRRYPRTALLRAISRKANQVHQHRLEGREVQPPELEFFLAGVARLALASANEHRDEPVTRAVVTRLCQDYIAVEDPDLLSGARPMDEYLRAMLFEQAGAQYSAIENLGRGYALMHDYLPQIVGAPNDTEWEAILGVSLDQYLRVGFVLSVAFVANMGEITRVTLFETDHVAPVWAPLTPEAAHDIADRHYLATVENAATEARRSDQGKWSFNPLEARPVLDTSTEIICPAPHFLIDKISCRGLFYTAIKAWGEPFAAALGYAFEAYVGDQLRLMGSAEVHEQVRQATGRGEVASCDWVVVTEACVVLVEVKASRPDLAYRTGGAPTSLKHIVEAVHQIRRTYAKLEERDPAYSHIPTDRPIVGLIVTLEAYHLGTHFDEHPLHNPDLPIIHVWSHELENAVSALMDRHDAGEAILAAYDGVDDRKLGSFASIVEASDKVLNP